MPDRGFDEKAIFLEAIDIAPPEERGAYLDAACANEPHLRAEVEALLREHERRQDLLDASGLIAPTIEPPPIADGPGQTIGRYKLLEEIGEGGMGVVYMAEQQEPVRRKVALKIIKPGMDTREVIARFEAERQALALMDHPNIAKVLDGGTTGGNPKSEARNPKEIRSPKSEIPSREAQGISDIDASGLGIVSDFGFRASDFTAGRPYFVMELVQGIPITEYCDQAKLTTRQRLALFVSVCQAVHHAHQKGIIHRDVKPSNVLVTLHDGVPVPKIIDFGIAKAVHQQLTEKSLFTGHGRMMGTPLYMSPEQAEMSGLDVDTRSDIYSLGVLLYELLTGSTPFDRERLREAGFDEVRRVIREEEPPRPSHRLSTLDVAALSTISGHRGVDARRLGRLLRGDLDWIVMKALQKDRTRRYESASALAADVERYLADEPVQARPPTLADRAAKWLRRRRALVATAALSLMLAWAAASIWIWHERSEAVRQRTQAEDNLRLARQAVDQMLTEVAEVSLQNVPQMEPVRKALLEKALVFYEGFLDQRGDEPGIRQELGHALVRVSEIYALLGQHAQAEQSCRQAIARFEQLQAEFPEQGEYRNPLADCHRRLAKILMGTGRLPEAEQACRRAIELFEAAATESPPVVADRVQLAEIINTHGIALWRMGRLGEAEASCRRAVDLQEELARQFPENASYQHGAAVKLNNLAVLALSRNAPEEARPLLTRAVQYEEAAGKLNPKSRECRACLRNQYENLGGALSMLKRHDEAVAMLEKALAMSEEFVRDFPHVPQYRQDLAGSLHNSANALKDAGRLADAEQNYRRSLALCETLAGEFPQIPDYRWQMAGNHQTLSEVLKLQGRLPEAIEHFRQQAKLRETLIKDFPSRADFRNQLANSYDELAWLLANPDSQSGPQGLTEAIDFAKKAIALAPQNACFHSRLGRVYYVADDLPAALEALQKSMELSNGGTSQDWLMLAMIHAELGDTKSGRLWYNKAVQRMDKDQPETEEHRQLRIQIEELLGIGDNPSTAKEPAGKPQ